MDTEFIKQLATDVNNVVIATSEPLQRQIDALFEDQKRLAKEKHILIDAINDALDYWGKDIGYILQNHTKGQEWLNTARDDAPIRHQYFSFWLLKQALKETQ